MAGREGARSSGNLGAAKSLSGALKYPRHWDHMLREQFQLETFKAPREQLAKGVSMDDGEKIRRLEVAKGERTAVSGRIPCGTAQHDEEEKCRRVKVTWQAGSSRAPFGAADLVRWEKDALRLETVPQ